MDKWQTDGQTGAMGMGEKRGVGSGKKGKSNGMESASSRSKWAISSSRQTLIAVLQRSPTNPPTPFEHLQAITSFRHVQDPKKSRFCEKSRSHAELISKKLTSRRFTRRGASGFFEIIDSSLSKFDPECKQERHEAKATQSVPQSEFAEQVLAK